LIADNISGHCSACWQS